MPLEYRTLHPWDLSPAAAIKLQRELAPLAREDALATDGIRYAAGADISFDVRRGTPTPVWAGFVVLELPDLKPAARAGIQTEAHFPYVPGLLSFREVPPLLKAWSRLEVRPDVLLADGQGRAHPRRFGIACHLGVLLNVPTIGVAKSRLVGTHDPVPEQAGGWAPVMDRGEVIGAALRTRAGVAPVYVSTGFAVTLEDAIAFTLRCCRGKRLPETSRQAHQFVNALRRGA